VKKFLPHSYIFFVALCLGGLPKVSWAQPQENGAAPAGEVVEVAIYCTGIGVSSSPGGVKAQLETVAPIARPFIFRLHPDWMARLAQGIAAAGEDPQHRLNMIGYSCQADLGYIGQWEGISSALERGAQKLGKSKAALALFDPRSMKESELKTKILAEGDSALYNWIRGYSEAALAKHFGSKFGPHCMIKLAYVPTMATYCKSN